MKDIRRFSAFPQQARELIDEEKIKKILAGEMKELNDYAKELGNFFAEGREREALSTSQVRNVLDEIQKMPEREFDENQLQLLRPKLAYIAGRHRGKVKKFQELLDQAIQLTNKDNFRNFKYFVEAIVAYHRYYGGK
ncbi:MAG: type III-A CRISPR-associated protein Csm2 [Clostridiales bacterium]|nr:type III-A CRISPR-associated protein Csm2 [Clostridiales bacterium]